MKHDKFSSGLTAWFLSVCIAMGGVGCMISGLNLEPEGIGIIFIQCCLNAAVCCLCFCTRRGGVVLVCLTAFLGGILYREGTLMLQVESLVYQISQIYDRGYDWGVIRWSGEYLADVPVDLGLSLIASVCAAASAWALCRGKSMLLPAVVCLLPLFSCMVVTDSVPGELWLFLLLVPLLLAILTNTVRRKSRRDGVRLTAAMLVPVLLAATLLFSAVPQNGYEAQLSGLQQYVFSWFRGLPFVLEAPDGQLFLSFDGDAGDKMNLAGVGPKARLYYPVMDVTAERSDFLYLRGQSFDTYDGTSWVSSYTEWVSSYMEGKQAQYWPKPTQLQPAGRVTISVRGFRNFRYMPYYPGGTDWADQILRGKLTNPDGLREYSFDRMELNGNWWDLDIPRNYNYLKLPDKTREAAEKYLAEHDLLMITQPAVGDLPFYDARFVGATGFVTTEAIANAIGNLVESSATYSLNTPKMPTSKSDFAMWFLNESETGYCVHFATAATVLLRAQGIPARYVTGYTCQAAAGQRVTVTADKAHAWVEYFDDDFACWRVLDPTPAGSGGGGGIPVGTSPTLPPVTTLPPETTGTEPTEPIETLPTEPVETLPLEPSRPTPTQPSPTAPSTAPTEPTGGGIGPGGSGGGLDLWDLYLQNRLRLIREIWQAVKPIVIALAWILGIAGLVFGQYLIRRRIRSRNMYTGHPNKRALARWREVLLMAKLLHTTAPDRLEHLAEKAKFSQHTLSMGELMEFDAWMEQERQNLKTRHWSFRLLCKLIWVVE